MKRLVKIQSEDKAYNYFKILSKYDDTSTNTELFNRDDGEDPRQRETDNLDRGSIRGHVKSKL